MPLPGTSLAESDGMGRRIEQIQAPMAVVILCGLASSTALNMLVVPALYRRFGALARPTPHAALTPAGDAL